ncbi:MAG: hypothetical protein ACXABG_08965 [Promethearchaeota archaeon]|jgi:hypothetical membrane protein
MEKLKPLVLNTYNFIPAPVYGLLSAVVGLSGDIISILLFEGYTLNRMISVLGTGPGGVFFNIGTILSGIFALLFYLYLIKLIGANDPKLFRAGRFFAINSCVFFSLVGIFPSSRNLIIFVLHGTFALLSWLSAIIYLGIFSYLIFKNKIISKFFGYLALITGISIIVFLLTWIPLIEWIMALLVSIWITSISIYLLFHKI